MEEKKNEKNVRKEEKKEIKKNVKKIEPEIKEDEVVITKDIKNIAKLVAYISTFFATITILLVFVFGIVSTLSITNSTKDELLKNNFTLTFVSKISNYSKFDTELAIKNMESKFLFVLFDVILPTIALICALILIILLANMIIKFVDTNSTEKDIFNKSNVKILENAINILSVILFITWVLFNSPSMPFVLIIYFLLYIVFILFKRNTKVRER